MRKYKSVRIGEVCSVTKGETGLASAIPGKYPLVTTGANRKTSNSYQFDAEAVCIPLVSSTGHGKKTLNYVHFEKGKFALGTILAAVIPKRPNEISAEYLYLYLQYYKDKKIVPLMQGAANVSLSIKNIEKIEVDLPPINEQKVWLDIYRKFNVSFTYMQEELSLQSASLKLLRQSILQDAIEGKLTVEWRKKNPVIKGDPETDAAALLEKIKKEKQKLIDEGKIKKAGIQDSIIKNKVLIPNTWVYPLLYEITKQISDGTHQTPTYVKEGKIFLSAQNVKPFRFLPENHQFVTQQAYDSYRINKIPELGDLLIARVGAGIGETAIINKKIDFAYYVSLCLVKVIKSITLPKYLAIVSNSPYGVNYAKGNVSSGGTSAGNYNLGRIRSFPIPLPPLAEQRAIVDRVDELLQIVDELEKEAAACKTLSENLMQALLKEAFEGGGEND
ncbi:MAG TPA: restriction endonuclease subunit S [Ignavibacteriaceae bacterium]|nr:restriction endonuclease subunit S [Ignavibacteriaceae bacterium]